LSKDERLAGLDFYAGEMEFGTEAGEGGLNEIEFTCGDSAGDEEHVGLHRLSKRGVKGFGGVGGGGEDDWLGAGVGNKCGEHGGVGIADFAESGFGANGNEFVAGSEDGYSRTFVDVELGITAGSSEGDLGGSETRAGLEKFIAATGLGAFSDDVFAGLDFALGSEANRVGRYFYMFEHDYAIGARGDGGTGHDFPCFAFGQTASGGLAGMRGAGDGKRDMRGGFGGATRVSIAGGTREWGLIVVGRDGGGEDAVEGVGELDALGAGIRLPG
jgi:hypothetical protein